MSSDAPSFFGLGVGARRLRIYADELSQWLRRDLLDAALTTLPKCRDSQLVCIGNAGVRGTWQEEVRFEAEGNGWYVFSAPGVLASWIRPEDLERIRQSLPEPVYLRFYENRWVSEVGTAITPEQWDSCKARIPPLDATTPLVLGIDAGVVSDTFSIVSVSRHSKQGEYSSEAVDTGAGIFLFPAARERSSDEIWVRSVAIFKPEGGAVDFSQPYRYLSDFVRRHRVEQVCYDPFQLHHFAQEFRSEHGVWVNEFPQGPQRLQADTTLLQLIRAGRLRHDGHEELRSHALNAAVKVGISEDTKARLVKSHPSKKIDALIACSMSASECLRLNL